MIGTVNGNIAQSIEAVEITPRLALDQFLIQPYQARPGKTVRVVRDDLLVDRGGTKRRTLQVLMPSIEKGEIVYSATPFGYGQVAVADACRAFNKSATIFTPQVAPNLTSYFLERARELGANIVEVELENGETFEKVTEEARKYAAANKNVRKLLRSGFDSKSFSTATANIIRAGMNLKDPVEEVWTIAGSGALSRSLQKVWPNAKHHIVRVREKDSVYGVDCDPGRAKIHDATEAFTREATLPPPFPSSANYDAKLWAHVQQYASDGAVVWNM